MKRRQRAGAIVPNFHERVLQQLPGLQGRTDVAIGSTHGCRRPASAPRCANRPISVCKPSWPATLGRCWTATAGATPWHRAAKTPRPSRCCSSEQVLPSVCAMRLAACCWTAGPRDTACCARGGGARSGAARRPAPAVATCRWQPARSQAMLHASIALSAVRRLLPSAVGPTTGARV